MPHLLIPATVQKGKEKNLMFVPIQNIAATWGKSSKCIVLMLFSQGILEEK